ncbi:MAG: carbon storage regulator CsrA [Granulosicoccus sp.]
MLILTRRVDERIFIGENITLCVLDIEGNRVRLGLDAPKEIAILREEIHERYSGAASNDSYHVKPGGGKKSA